MDLDSNAAKLTIPAPFAFSMLRKATKVTTNVLLRIQLKRVEQIQMWLNLLSVSFFYVIVCFFFCLSVCAFVLWYIHDASLVPSPRGRSPIMYKLHVVVMRKNNRTRYTACNVFTRRWLTRDTRDDTTRTMLQPPPVPPSVCL